MSDDDPREWTDEEVRAALKVALARFANRGAKEKFVMAVMLTPFQEDPKHAKKQITKLCSS
jgi:hypothetical protein